MYILTYIHTRIHTQCTNQYEAIVQLITLIQCCVTKNIRTTPLSKRPEVLMAELRPGSGPEI